MGDTTDENGRLSVLPIKEKKWLVTKVKGLVIEFDDGRHVVNLQSAAFVKADLTSA